MIATPDAKEMILVRNAILRLLNKKHIQSFVYRPDIYIYVKS